MTAFPTGSHKAMTADARRARRLIAGSRLALWLERAWHASWRGLCLVGAGVALALFDLWSFLPPGPRIVALSAWMVAIVALFWIDWAKVFWPSREAGIRHLEDANALAHRPISAAEDTMAGGQGDALTEALWRRHLDAQTAYFAGLKAAWPKPNLAAQDPYAVRAVVFIGLAAGLLIAGTDAPRRLGTLFNVEGDRAATAGGIALDAWITPPPYTGLPPVILSQAKGSMPLDRDRVLSVPVGSKLTLRLDSQNAPTIERIALDGDAKPAADDASGKPVQPGGTDEITLAASERIRVFDAGRKAGDWEITVLPDAPPSIAFDGEIDATARLATHIPFAGGDDYGVTKAEAHITLAPEAEDGHDPSVDDGSEELVVPLPLGSNAKAVKSALFEDLTAHPWAGLPVIVQLSATDAADQTGLSEEKQFTLPERAFHNPLAKAIIEQRKNLSRGPAAIPNVALALDALTLAPEMFGMKSPVYLGLRSAYWQLKASRVHKDVTEVQALLWDIALSIEDGGVTAAAEHVRELQKQLQQALKDGASDEKIQQLTQQLRDAMRQMMDKLAQNAPETDQPLDENSMSEDDLNQMLDRIEEMSKLGAKDAAEQLLSQMQQMMEGLQGPMAQPSEKEKQLAKTLAQLNEIIRQQQALRDQTFHAGQQQDDQPAPTTPDQQKQLADQQKQLSDRVKKLENDLKNPPKPGQDKQPDAAQAQGQPQAQPDGQPQPDDSGQPDQSDDKSGKPTNLSDASQSMDKAEGSIRQSNEDDAVGAQDEALAKLKSDQDAAKQALAAEQKKNGGMRIGRSGGRRPGTDPAGRPDSEGNIDNGSVKIPTERETQRARDILNELRKRSGESTRPAGELDYLDRLLKRF